MAQSSLSDVTILHVILILNFSNVFLVSFGNRFIRVTSIYFFINLLFQKDKCMCTSQRVYAHRRRPHLLIQELQATNPLVSNLFSSILIHYLMFNVALIVYFCHLFRVVMSKSSCPLKFRNIGPKEKGSLFLHFKFDKHCLLLFNELFHVLNQLKVHLACQFL